MKNYEKGTLGEIAVAYYLEALGYEILCRNFRTRGGEIDIVATKGETLCFVEVKTRKLGSVVSGMAAVDERKQSLIIRASYAYCEKYQVTEENWYFRYDIAEVTTWNDRIIDIDYLENAFDESDFHGDSQKFF